MWRKLNRLLSTAIPWLILLGFCALLVCYINRWDSLAWLTIIPVWIWAGIGVAASLLSWIFFRSNTAIFTLCLCLLAGIVFSEETLYLLRDSRENLLAEESPEENESEKKIRIVTINCKDGNFKAALAVAELKPDIVFFQESPLRPELSQIADEIFGKKNGFNIAMSGSRHGNAILARGDFLIETPGKNTPTVHLRLRFPESGQLIDLTNVDLEDSIPRLDMWKHGIRKRLTLNRIFNRRELRSYVKDYDIKNQQPPRIVAGDFSTPPGDDVFRFLKKSGLQDCFPVSGKGWGNTFTSKAPYLRTDQIWISPDIIPLESWTVTTPHSDHRILLCDFVIKKGKHTE